MTDPMACELHEVAVFATAEDREELLRLTSSPIGDECQMCPVCRSAREYVGLRLAEKSGAVFPQDRNSEAAWSRLQTAVASVRTTVHPRR